jgi:hypothetical protein
MGFRDLDDFLGEAKPIELPIRGKTYSFPGTISARTGLLLHRLTNKADKVDDMSQADAEELLGKELLGDAEHDDLRSELLGDAELQMARDGLTSAHVDHVFRTLMVWHLVGPEQAEKAWNSVGEAPAPNRAARRATARKTRSRASTAGSTSASKPAATGSAGPSSSSTGS